MEYTDIHFDCRAFKGGIPCLPNKLRGKQCHQCDEYDPVTFEILIIKLGALGDVIRTTPLVTKFREEFPGCRITWVTQSPAILPKDKIEQILGFDFSTQLILEGKHFEVAVNLDKEQEACNLLAKVNARKKMGFITKDGHLAAADDHAVHKILTGAFDSLSKANTKNYLEEIFEICGFKFNGEEYLLNVNVDFLQKWNTIKVQADGKKVIGLNTGCGPRWATRLWPEQYWVELVQWLKENRFYPVLLGGKDEDERNLRLQKETGAFYPGYYSLEEFIAITTHCDLVVTAVSMMMHIATALKKKLVLFNNIFNPHEFYLYERGRILEPVTGCDCFYGNHCSRSRLCMQDLEVRQVTDAILNLSA